MLTLNYRPKFSHRFSSRFYRLMAWMLWGCLAVFPLAAQDGSPAQILSIWQGHEPVDATRPGALCWQRGSDFYESEVIEVGDTLSPGDMLSRGPCPAIWRDTPTAGNEDIDEATLQIGLRCGDGTELMVSGPSFLVMVLDPLELPQTSDGGPQDCAVDLAQGTLDVIAEQPMEVHSGGVTIGVEGTQFVVERLAARAWSGAFNAATRGFEGANPTETGAAVICRLLEGRVRLSMPEGRQRTSRPLEPGRQWLHLDDVSNEVELLPEFVTEAATRLVQADVARSWSAGDIDRTRSGCAPCEAVEEALPAYIEALRPGADPQTRHRLIEQMETLGLADASVREHRRFDGVDPRTDTRPSADSAPLDSPCPSPDASGVGECPDLAPQASDPALQRVVLPLAQGVVVLDLPQPLQTGQPIAGYMTVAGAGEGRRAESGVRKLSKLHVTVGDVKLPVQEGPWSEQFSDVPPNGTVPVALRNRKGKALVQRSVELLEAMEPDVPTQFTVSELCQADKPLVISGPFDGDPSNTQVLLDGEELVRQAERPGQLVVACPETAHGGGSLHIVEGTLQHQVESFRNIEVDLDLERSSLRRGQRTRATVTVRGLEGRDRPLGLRILNTVPAVIRMEGGDARFLTLWPSAWGDGDTYSQTFELKALQNGVARLLVEPVPLP